MKEFKGEQTAASEFERRSPTSGEIHIWIDPHKDGQINCAMHELLHAVFDKLLSPVMVYELEEAAILSWEKRIYEFAVLNKTRLLAWRRTLDAKIADSDDDS